jgi:hypothetical protein
VSAKVRIIVLAAFVVVVMTVAGIYVVRLRHAEAAATGDPQTPATLDATAVLAKPHLVFRSSALGPDYGRLSVAPLANPNSGRATLTLSCQRVYATAHAGVCITAKRGVVQTYAVATLDAGLQQVSSTPLAGLPSRARMSPDATMFATTTFVTGHSYAQSTFSTDTQVHRDGKSLGSLESFTTFIDGHELKAVNRNFWGVTFAPDDDTFYATASTGASTWLVRGSFARRQMQSLHPDAECPSLSPDGTKVAYKKRLGSTKPGVWRLAVLDFATGRETLLAETRSVDDQVEWLDNDHLLYGLSREGAEGTISDVWQVPADGTGAATVFLAQASSPAVVPG